MIGALAELFVERVPVSAPHRALVPATRVLAVDAVDAAGQSERLRELLIAVEAGGPVSTSTVSLDRLAEATSEFDAIWLIAGSASDPAYCALVHGELEARFPRSTVELLIVGADIDAAVMRGGPGWRRRSAVNAAAESLVRRLAQ